MLNTILWDHDGVLVDTEHLYFRATADILARAGVQLTVEHYRQFHLIESRGSWHLAEHLTPGDIDAMRSERNARYKKMVTEGNVLVPGAIALLQQLKAHCRMAIVTSSWREPFEAIHRGTGLTDLVEFVLTRGDYGEAKPDPEPYLTAVARLGVAKENCVVVEDSPRGLLAARAAGLRCWMVYSEITAGMSFDGAERQFPSLAAAGEALLAAATPGALD